VTDSAEAKNDFPFEASIPDGIASLDSILCTEELHRRPLRPPDYEKENRALVALASALADPQTNILQILANTILDVTQCDSSGLSLLTKDDGGKRFYWPAIAGIWKPHIGGGTPRDFGPCGDVLDRNRTLLFQHFERRYPYLLPVTPPAEECLLVPFYVGGKAVGTIWAIMHSDRRKFDAEDERLLSSLGQFASLAYELETKVAERTAELRRSEAYLAEAQRLSHTGSWAFIPAAGKHTYWSEEIFRITGFDPAGGPPRFEEFERRVHPDDLARTKEHFRMAIREKVDFDYGYRILHPGGEIRDIHVIGHPVFSPSGDVLEFVGTMMDVTERRRAEEERQALAHANRITTMGQLTASIAHEVSQPIATARNNAASALRFLSRNPPDLEEVREALGCIVSDVDRAGDVIDGIRKLIQKAPPPRDDCLDINGAIREVIVLTRGEALKNGVSVRMQLADGLPLIQGDRVQLQQVVLNLILNAFEAMSSVDDARRELSISTGRRGADEILVAVRDWGPGIDPEHLDRVFQSFYTTKPSGMGLGLSICRSIVDAHAGRLWADANEPRGAVFQFTLPAGNNDS
jgi:PAS domain S-box-containing protein